VLTPGNRDPVERVREHPEHAAHDESEHLPHDAVPCRKIRRVAGESRDSALRNGEEP
jgi:hypothetical protein